MVEDVGPSATEGDVALCRWGKPGGTSQEERACTLRGDGGVQSRYKLNSLKGNRTHVYIEQMCLPGWRLAGTSSDLSQVREKVLQRFYLVPRNL